MILTCDRDHGDIEPYPNIKVNDWNEIGKAKVYYVPPKGFKFSIIKKLSKQVDIIYCCGCFNDYAINTLLLNRIGLIKPPLVVASMGLFSPLEFSLKYKKKKYLLQYLIN
ncbi:putative glycosyl transferase, group 1 [[Clostridium] sordellii ATCC 9714]|nr:putative glycosyl transferase, group 1 [[Clostridium] sordellii ATCC 9714] [Paeniclostridium sordellii ATCC 9714]